MKQLDLRSGGTVVRRVITLATVAFATLLAGCIQDGVVARFQLKPDHIIVEHALTRL